MLLLLSILLLWVGHRARVAQADAQVLGAVGHVREDSQHALQRREGVGRLLRRRHGRKNAALRAQKYNIPNKQTNKQTNKHTCIFQC